MCCVQGMLAVPRTRQHRAKHSDDVTAAVEVIMPIVLHNASHHSQHDVLGVLIDIEMTIHQPREENEQGPFGLMPCEHGRQFDLLKAIIPIVRIVGNHDGSHVSWEIQVQGSIYVDRHHVSMVLCHPLESAHGAVAICDPMLLRVGQDRDQHAWNALVKHEIALDLSSGPRQRWSHLNEKTEDGECR